MKAKIKNASSIEAAGFAGSSSKDGSFGGRIRVVPSPETEVVGEKASDSGVILFSIALFVFVCVVVIGAWYFAAGAINVASIVVAAILATLAVMSTHIAQQWERVVVLRLGKFNRVSGPGLFWTIPFIESNTMRVDMRTRVTTFGAEETLTADLMPLDVNAVLFWHVYDAKAACIEVGDFAKAVELAAQTALRDAIGRGGAAEVAIRREQLDRELKRALEEKVATWGIAIFSVEVRDILLPPELQEVMSLEAQSEQRKKARIILMEAEQDITDMLAELAKAYEDNDAAMRLRAMHLLYESVRETGGTIVVPSSFSEGFSDVLGDSVKKAVSSK